MKLIVEYYRVAEAERLNAKYPKLCDECIYTPVWTVRHQLSGEYFRTGYACGEHVDTVLMKIAKGLPGGDIQPPAE